MNLFSKIILTPCLLMMASFIVHAQADAPGAKDHPLITRYPGSVIKWFDVQEFDRYKIATGPVTGYRHIDEWLPVEGKVTRIYYSLSGTRAVTEVYLNYLNAIKKAGFEILAEGLHKSSNIAKQVGGRGWQGVYFAENSFPSSEGILMNAGSSSSGGSAFVAGKLSKNNATVYVAVNGYQYRSDVVLFMIDIIEEQIMDDDLVKLDPDAMFSELETTGKVAIYGIYFDTGMSSIKPDESKETLDIIADLLRKKPDLKLYVVGHTDDTGDLPMNMGLSRERADAVVNALVDQYQISRSRLSSFGAGPHAPASTNLNKAGRKLNRRVELVQRLK